MSDLNEMLIFAKVVNEGGFTAAARVMDLQKSYVSRKVGQLEERLDMKLLERTTRRVSLTDAGKIYYEHCQRVLHEVEAADLAVAQMHTIPTGTLKVSAPVAMGSLLLSDLISGFLKAHQQINVEMLLTDHALEMLDSGIDIAFGAGPVPGANYISRKLGEATWVLCASPGYVSENGEPEGPESLPGHNTILYGSLYRPGIWEFSKGGHKKEINVQGKFVVNDLATVKHSVLQGVGISMLPVMIAAKAIKEGRLVALLTDWRLRSDPVYVAYPSSRHLSAKLQAFLSYARSTGARPDPWAMSLEEALAEVPV